MFSYQHSEGTKGQSVIMMVKRVPVAIIPVSSIEEGEKLGREWVDREFAQLRYGGERAGSLMKAKRGIVAGKDRHNGQD